MVAAGDTALQAASTLANGMPQLVADLLHRTRGEGARAGTGAKSRQRRHRGSAAQLCETEDEVERAGIAVAVGDADHGPLCSKRDTLQKHIGFELPAACIVGVTRPEDGYPETPTGGSIPEIARRRNSRPRGIP